MFHNVFEAHHFSFLFFSAGIFFLFHACPTTATFKSDGKLKKLIRCTFVSFAIQAISVKILFSSRINN